MARAEKGVSGAGLMTTVHPAARAGPSLRVIIAEGKFHGVRIELESSFSLGSLDNRNLHTQRLSKRNLGVRKKRSPMSWLYLPTGCLITTVRVFGSGFGI